MKASFCFTAIAVCLLNFCCISTKAQYGFEIGVKASGLIYQGDIAPSPLGSYTDPRLGGGVFISKPVSKFLSVRGSFDIGYLKDNDAAYTSPEWKQYRGLKFKTTIAELSANLVYNLKSNLTNYSFSPYVFGGLGVAFTNVKRDASGFHNDFPDWQDWVRPGLAEDLATTPPTTVVTIPVGFGFRHRITDNISLFGEGAYRFMFTDYLDGFSKVASKKWNDHYSNLSVGLIFSFGDNGIGCPRF